MCGVVRLGAALPTGLYHEAEGPMLQRRVVWRSLAMLACAWALWEEGEFADIPTRPPSKWWKVHVAADTRTECEAILKRHWENRLLSSQPSADRPGIDKVTSVPGYVSVTYKRDPGHTAWSSYTFYCFPDTIDPRPKGKD